MVDAIRDVGVLFIIVMLLFVSGCTTVYNDQSACTTDCNIGSYGYAGGGADIENDQSACTHDCNIGAGARVYSVPPQVNWSANVIYYPYNLHYQRGPMVIYHY